MPWANPNPRRRAVAPGVAGVGAAEVAFKDQAKIRCGYADALVGKAETGQWPVGAQCNGDAAVWVGIAAGIVPKDEQHLPQSLPVALNPDRRGWLVLQNSLKP